MKKFAVEFKWAVRYIFAYLAWIMGEKVLGVYDTHIDWLLLSSLGFYLFGFVLYVLALREKTRHRLPKANGLETGLCFGFLPDDFYFPADGFSAGRGAQGHCT